MRVFLASFLFAGRVKAEMGHVKRRRWGLFTVWVLEKQAACTQKKIFTNLLGFSSHVIYDVVDLHLLKHG